MEGSKVDPDHLEKKGYAHLDFVVWRKEIGARRAMNTQKCMMMMFQKIRWTSA